METLSGALFRAKSHHAAGRLADAEEAYRQVLNAEPGRAEVHHLLGVVCQAQGRGDEAVALLREAVRLMPEHVEACNDLGVALALSGELRGAVASFERALRQRPDDAAARNNLRHAAVELNRRGIALVRENALDQAVSDFREALRIRPDVADLHCNLGIALECRGDLDEAVACLRRAITLAPELALAHGSLGTALVQRGQVDEGLACYGRAIELNPDDDDARHNRLFTLSFSPLQDARSIRDEHRRWGDWYARRFEGHVKPHRNDRSPERRLRVGYVSPDFCGHCQAFFTVPLFSAHDRRTVEVFCYSDVARPDEITARLRASADVWRDVGGRTDDEVADQVRGDGIDVLVDLTMHMAHNRLAVFARKPAPVQVSWLAYPGRTGLPTIDYRLTDPHLDPPDLGDGPGPERPVRLPDAFWCYDPLTREPAVNALPALSEPYLTFGCLNSFAKVNVPVLKLWARVLGAVRRSRLRLLAPEGSARRDALRVLGDAGVGADRVSFVGRRPRREYLGCYQQIDIGLDTFPSNGHTTSLDSFWMGVPVVTLVGETAVGRAGLCLLRNLGLADLAAATPDDFVRIAAGLAADLPRLAALRATLRDRAEGSPLMDARRFARNVEGAYRLMWHGWCASPPADPG